MKINCFPNPKKKPNLGGTVALFYMFASLLNVWLQRRHLDLRICFCSQLQYLLAFKNSTVCWGGNESKKHTQHLNILMKIVLSLQTPERVSGTPGPRFENCCSRALSAVGGILHLDKKQVET